MKKIIGILCGCAAWVASYATSSSGWVQTFENPMEKVQTAAYWYWLSGNISKEGVVQDLHAMKRAGINRVFIGNIGQKSLYTDRSVKMFSDVWWEVIHTALKTATELNIEIGMFNCPGWSQSGGPWIKPEQSMRYLAASSHRVAGGRRVTMNLLPEQILKAKKSFQPVKTIAYPAPKDYGTQIEGVRISMTEGGKTHDNLVANKRNQMVLTLAEPTLLRSLTIQTTRSRIKCKAHLEAEIDGKWCRLADFMIDRSNPSIGVGFDPWAPITVSFPATTTQRLRLTTEAAKRSGGIKQFVLSAQPRVAYYAEKSLAKTCQTSVPAWDHYMWAKQAPLDDTDVAIDPKQVVDISDKVSADGTLDWEVPAGDWIVLHTGMVPTGMTNTPATPEATGLEVDKMNDDYLAAHFDAYIGEVMRRVPPEDRKTFKVIVQDSYETGSQNITDHMLEQFEAEYGYSMIPYLPVYYGLVVGDQDKSDRFLWDLRRFISDQVAYQYVAGFRKVCNDHGFTSWMQCYGHWGFPGEFLQYGGQSDEVSGEFWTGRLGDVEVRAASSCGHIYNKSRIWAESHTSSSKAFSNSPVNLKLRTDKFFAEGINATLLHLYIHQPDTAAYPGLNAWFGTEFNEHNTWFSHFDLFTAYVKRCGYMLQQGLNVADVAYFIGEDAPKMSGVRNPALPTGYQYDYINAEVLKRDAKVVDGRITLPHGTSYRVLVLPPQQDMRPELLAKIKELVLAGAVVVGMPPHRSPSLENYPQADNMVEALAREMWEDCYSVRGMNQYGKGLVFNGYTLKEVFAAIGLNPDCRYSKDLPLLYTHRSTGSEDIYFVTNQSKRAIEDSIIFRVDKTLIPEVWNTTDGSRWALADYQPVSDGIRIPVKLAAMESCLLVFRKQSDAPKLPKLAQSLQLDKPWKLTFDSRFSTPKPIKLKSLIDLSKSEFDEIRHFSGSISYNTRFAWKKNMGAQVHLNIGNVACMAKVYLNGQYVGGTWCPPYRVDLSKYIKSGQNHLRIEVVNTWVNRIIGDMQLPKEQRNIKMNVNPWKADSKLPTSGLLGPVTLVYEN